MHATVLRRPLSVALAALLVFTMLPFVGAPPAAHAAVPPANVDYNSVDFVDEMWGWVAGSNGTILRTRNGGNNWEVLDTPTTETFVAVSFVDRSHGWASTVDGRVYRTTNGGASWLGPSTPRWRGSTLADTEGIVYDLHFVSTSMGFLTARGHVPDSGKPGVPGIIYRTTDGGIIWTRVFEGPDYSHQDDPTPEGNSILRGIDFVSTTHGWVAGVDRRPIPARSLVYRTTDGGRTWTSAGSGLTGSADLHGISFADTQVGLAVGTGGAIRKTTNGGATWTAQTSGTETLRDVFMLDTQNAWAVGDNGTVRRTQNGGASWTSGWAQEASGRSLRSLHLIGSPSLKGWLAGTGGRVRITIDGQNWWTPVPGPEVTGISSATHPNEDSWYGDAAGLPQFSWDPVSGAEGYSVSFSTDRTEVPKHEITLGSSETEWTFAGPLSDGVWYFNVKAKADGGNWGSPATYIVHHDTTVPSGSIVLAGGATYTKVHDVSVTSPDPVVWGPSGAAKIAFSLDGGTTWGAWRDYASPINVTLPSGDGDKTVHARFRNGAGTVSETDASDSIILDTLVPSASVSINDGDFATATRDVEVSVSVDEWGVSGPGQMRFSTNGGTSWDAWRAFSSPTALTLPSGDGSKTVHAQVRDAAGNVSPSASDSIVLDTAAPEITAIDSSSHPEESVWYPGRNVQLEWSAQSLSGVSDYSYTWNAGSALEPDTASDTSASTYTVGGVADGEWYFSVRARNVAGVWGPSESRVVRIDGTAPLGTITINGGNSYTASRDVEVASDVEWGPSGADAIQYRVDGQQWSDWQPYSSSIAVTLTEGDGEKTVDVRFLDKAGNVSDTVSGTVIYDTVETSATITVADGARFTKDPAVTVKSDVVWGSREAGTMQFRINGGEWSEKIEFEPSYELDLTGPDGEKTIDARFFDNDDRTIVAPPVTITLDTTKPTGSIRINDGAATTTSTSVKVTTSNMNWGASGPHAQAMQISVDGGSTWRSWRSYASPVSVTLPDGAGTKTVSMQFRDAAGNVSAIVSSSIELSPEALPSIIKGDNRYLTAIAGSKAAFPNGAPAVVIATGEHFADALGGAGLAGALKSPLLLTEKGALPGAVSSEVTRLKAKKAYILGGTGAVSANVESALKRQLGNSNVVRIAGPDRYQTANAVAAETIKVLNASGTYNGDAFIATGANFPDALGASPIAAAEGMPVFLADPARSSVNLPASVKRVWITGGTAVVSQGVENSLKSRLGNASVKRLAGGDRFATAAAVARFGVGRGMQWDGVGITTGMNFPDALAAGPVLGSRNAVMLLTDANRVPAPTASALSANKAKISKVTFFGGDAAVPPGVRTTVNNLIK